MFSQSEVLQSPGVSVRVAGMTGYNIGPVTFPGLQMTQCVEGRRHNSETNCDAAVSA